jgi:glycosyltransferase involved in cell wall biosynthesis
MKRRVSRSLEITGRPADTLPMSDRLKILMVLKQYPWPLAHGLHLRMFHLAAALQGTCSLDLVCFADHDPPPAIRQTFGRIETRPRPPVPPPAGRWSRLRDRLAIDTVHPVDSGLAARLREIIHEGGYDLIWAYAPMVPHLPHVAEAGVPIIADVVDDGVLEWLRAVKREFSPREFLHNLWYLSRQYRIERRYLSRQRVSAAFFASEIDASIFHRVQPRTPVEVIPNGVDIDYFAPEGRPIESGTIVFEGSMGFFPNAHGAVHFAHEIFPRILAEVPTARFQIVGNKPTPEVAGLASERIEVTGFVDDVRPYLDRAAVFVSPLRTGGGIKNKILQAWAMGKACVATSVCTGGLAVREGENILIRDDPTAFADAVVRLLRDARESARLGANARKTILEHYTWERQAEKLEALMRRLVSGSSSASQRRDAAH